MKTIIKSMTVLSFICALSAQATPLYTKCIACHGAAGEKSALNKSMIIKDLSKDAFIASMKGYKAGTYGKEMKAMMKAQVATLTDAQIEEIANFIAKK
ncbi:MAG: c-type cytochrome [Sulfurospirillaceae bacterium]|nr:c-type cytochrome [Sulfurospirillaceae bacterium]MDD2827483.1 c-type cytochrome [Sulfurospirillaceae bacterium]